MQDQDVDELVKVVKSKSDDVIEASIGEGRVERVEEFGRNGEEKM